MESAMAQTERGWLSSLASQEERADHICHGATLQGDAGDDLLVTRDSASQRLFGDAGRDTAIADSDDVLVSIEV
jgi:hypothetical protein